MALRKMLAKRLSNGYRAPSPAVTLDHTPISSATTLQTLISPKIATAGETSPHREYTSPASTEKGFFRRFFHRKTAQMSLFPELLSIPVGDKLREKLKGSSVPGDRIRLDGLVPPLAPEPVAGYEKLGGISVEDTRKLLRVVQAEKLKARLRAIPESSISYDAFLQICVGECGNYDQGVEFAKMLDQSGNVIVLANVVFLRPEQLAKSMEKLISQWAAPPDDPRRKQLEGLEKEKALIDRNARAQVWGELYCGLGFIVVQILGAMRLTFWELSWDVMEPICFFATSLSFVLGYGFFLRTSVEPSFEGYFRRRFRARQQKLMKIHKFDIEKYNNLRRALYPNIGNGFPNFEHHKPLNIGEDGAFRNAIYPSSRSSY